VERLRVDDEGVPKLVQKVKYNRETGLFTLTFFNNKSRMFTRSEICPVMGVFNKPTWQELELADKKATELAEKEWRQWFLELRIVT